MAPDAVNARSERALAWVADLVAVLYFAWSYLALARLTAAIATTIAGLGAEVPRPTAFVLARHHWLYPLVFGGAGLAVVAKELALRDKRVSVVVTFVIALLVLWASDWLRALLFHPLLGLLERLA